MLHQREWPYAHCGQFNIYFYYKTTLSSFNSIFFVYLFSELPKDSVLPTNDLVRIFYYKSVWAANIMCSISYPPMLNESKTAYFAYCTPSAPQHRVVDFLQATLAQEYRLSTPTHIHTYTYSRTHIRIKCLCLCSTHVYSTQIKR